MILCALFNSFPFDWLVRQKAATHLSLYILDALPVPRLNQADRRFLARGALTLTCNHPGYTRLWQDQVTNDTIPPLPKSDGLRWALRAQIDAIIARAYGLKREYYEHLLQSFSQRLFPGAAMLCLEAFDALQQNRPIDVYQRHLAGTVLD